MLRRDSLYLVAILVRLWGEVEQGLNLLQRKAEFAGTLDKAKALEVRGAVVAIRTPSWRWFDDSDPFVVADRLYVASTSPRDFANLHP